MTRVLFTADSQIGKGLDLYPERLDEQAAVWQQTLALALEHHADLVIHGGDVFEGPVVLPEHYEAFTRPLEGFPIPVVVALGNGRHDSSVRKVTALSAVRAYARVSTRPELISVAGVVVATLPSIGMGHLRALMDGGADTSETAAILLLRIAADLRKKAERDHPGVPCVLVPHWAISGAALPSGLPVDEMREPILEVDALERLRFDAVLAGHVHKPQLLGSEDAAGPMLYAGSPQCHDHGEEGFAHGVWLVDVATGDTEFLPIESRRFLTFDADLIDRDLPVEPHDALVEVIDAERIAAGGLDGAILKFRYRATAEQARRISVPALEQALLAAGAHRVFVEPHKERPARARVEGMTATLAPLEALDLWIANQDPPLTGAQAHGLREWTRRALTEAGT